MAHLGSVFDAWTINSLLRPFCVAVPSEQRHWAYCQRELIKGGRVPSVTKLGGRNRHDRYPGFVGRAQRCTLRQRNHRRNSAASPRTTSAPQYTRRVRHRSDLRRISNCPSQGSRGVGRIAEDSTAEVSKALTCEAVAVPWLFLHVAHACTSL